jgi:hypothetical protein
MSGSRHRTLHETHLIHALAWCGCAICYIQAPNSLPSSCSLLPPPAAGRASETHWPSLVSPRMDSRSVSSMVLPSEDSSLSKPNLRILLSLNGENKKSPVSSYENKHQDMGDLLRASRHIPSLTDSLSSPPR